MVPKHQIWRLYPQYLGDVLLEGHLPIPVHHYAYIASIVMAMKSGDKYN